MSTTKRFLGVMSVAVLAMVTAACGGDEGGGGGSASPGIASEAAGGARTVNATEKDFAIALDTSTAGSGQVDFEITNEGPSTHEFVVFETDLAPDALPLNKDGDVDEEGKGVTHIDEVEDIASGSTESLDVSLETGGYVVICNLPGHYKLGMHAPLTVS
jgi:Sulfocyanin (SoxE) domain